MLIREVEKGKKARVSKVPCPSVKGEARGCQAGNPEPRVGGGGGPARGRNLFSDFGQTVPNRGYDSCPVTQIAYQCFSKHLQTVDQR